jgi:hypothetical protein
MNIEGVWKLEMMGLNGWEQLSTVFMEDGRYLSASANHYSIGSYQVDGDVFEADTSVIQHGDVRTLFGSKKKRLDVSLKGTKNKDGSVIGTISPPDSQLYEINIRLTPLGKMD